MRRVPEVLDCWFESGSMPFAQVHYPFENTDWFDSHYPRRFHRRVQRADARLVLHAARARDRAVRPSGVQNRCRPRHRPRRRRPEDEQVEGQLPRRQRGVRPRRLRRHAVVPDVVADPARRQPGRHRAGHPRGRATGAAAAVERLELPAAVRVDRPERGAPTRSNVLDRYILAKLRRDPRRRSPTRSRPMDIAGACDELRTFCDALTNWYVRRSRSRFWDEDRDAIDTLHTVARGRDAARGTAAAAGHRGDLAWADRRALGAPHRLAHRGRTARRSRARRRDGRGPRCLLDGAVAAQGAESPRAAAVAARHGRDTGLGAPRTVRRPDQGRGQRQEGRDLPTTWTRTAVSRSSVNARVAGPRLGKDVQKVIKAVKAGDWTESEDGVVTAAGIELLPEEYTQQARRGGTGIDRRTARRQRARRPRHGRVPRNSRPRAGPRTASGSCRTRAATWVWMCPTGSRCSSRFPQTAPSGQPGTVI